MFDFERNYTMGKLTWLGWATTWEEVQKAPQASSIIMGKNLVRNAPPLTRESQPVDVDSLEDSQVDVNITQDEESAESNGSENRHFEISFPIARTPPDKTKQSGK